MQFFLNAFHLWEFMQMYKFDIISQGSYILLTIFIECIAELGRVPSV